ncbi:MAG: GNAT family N-acetyltransferase, cg3035/Rv0428c family, partial [Steroidobacteraceae bacterium]
MSRTSPTEVFSAAEQRIIEDASLNASAPPQQRWIDGWLVRTSPGKAKRARCIQPVAPGFRSVDERLAACEAVFREANLPLLFRITPFAEPGGLDELLQARGWHRFDETLVMALRLNGEAPSASPTPLPSDLTASPRPEVESQPRRTAAEGFARA